MRENVVSVVEGLEETLAEVGARRKDLEGTVHRAGADLASAERRLRLALGGLRLDRWRAFTDGRASIRSSASGREANLAARRAVAVEQALRELEGTRIDWYQRIDRARGALDSAEQAVKAFGPLVDIHGPSVKQMTQAAADGSASIHERPETADPEIALQLEAPQQEVPLVSTRETVKEYQRRLVQLDADHSRAQERLEVARRKRDEVVAAQEELVSAAEREVEKTVFTMATAVGPELAANLLDLDVARVKQLVRRTNTQR